VLEQKHGGPTEEQAKDVLIEQTFGLYPNPDEVYRQILEKLKISALADLTEEDGELITNAFNVYQSARNNAFEKITSASSEMGPLGPIEMQNAALILRNSYDVLIKTVKEIFETTVMARRELTPSERQQGPALFEQFLGYPFLDPEILIEEVEEELQVGVNSFPPRIITALDAYKRHWDEALIRILDDETQGLGDLGSEMESDISNLRDALATSRIDVALNV
jgi:hypothetical protein